VQAGEEQGDEIFYTDKGGWRDHEYVSLGVDHLPVLAGRTPIQARSSTTCRLFPSALRA
jgi:hypothetical protein